MSAHTMLMTGKILMSVIAIFTIVGPFLADWNVTHIYNPAWSPHAKFHNAQTMAIAVLLDTAALYFLWRKGGPGAALGPAVLFTGFYWLSQALAFIFPGVAWTDANLLKPGQSLSDMPIQLKADLVILPLVALGAVLIARGQSRASQT